VKTHAIIHISIISKQADFVTYQYNTHTPNNAINFVLYFYNGHMNLFENFGSRESTISR